MDQNRRSRWARIRRREDFDVVNPAEVRRWPAIARAIRFARRYRQRIPVPNLKLPFLKQVETMNRQAAPREPLTPAFSAELKRFFADDVALLCDLIGRDLGGWVR